MKALDTEIGFFESQRDELEQQHIGKWAVIHERELLGLYDAFNSAASAAVERFGRGPYLIRQIGAESVVLPASAMYVFGGAN